MDLALVTKVWVIEHRDRHTQLGKLARPIVEGAADLRIVFGVANL
jgi:hypothetical protein